MTKQEKEVYDEACGLNALREEIEALNVRLSRVYNAGINGIEYVAVANYARREEEALDYLDRAMWV